MLADIGELLLCIKVRRGTSKPFGGDGSACVLMAWSVINERILCGCIVTDFDSVND